MRHRGNTVHPHPKTLKMIKKLKKLGVGIITVGTIVLLAF
jgi:hypothetical protein